MVVVALAAACAIAAAPSLAAAAPLFVNGATGSDAGACPQSNPCQSIHYAVSQASSGDTINIAPGTYHEAVKATIPLTFIGSGASGAGATEIDSSGDNAPAIEFDAGGSVSDLGLHTGDSGIGGALNVSGGSVTAQSIDASSGSAGQTNGTDAISVTGATSSLDLSDSTAFATNNDTDITNGGACTNVVNDGSGLEVASGASATVTASNLQAVLGMALRVRIPSGSPTVNVSDTLIESSGTEDIASQCDGWAAIESAAGTLTLTGDTVTTPRSAAAPTASRVPTRSRRWPSRAPRPSCTTRSSPPSRVGPDRTSTRSSP